MDLEVQETNKIILLQNKNVPETNLVRYFYNKEVIFMAKVTFEFDGITDEYDISLVINRHKLSSALSKINDLRYKLVNDKLYDDVIVDINTLKNNPDTESKQYIKVDYICDYIQQVLEDVYNIIE